MPILYENGYGQKPHHDDSFSFQFEYVMVFPLDIVNQTTEAKYCIDTMLAQGLELYM